MYIRIKSICLTIVNKGNGYETRWEICQFDGFVSVFRSLPCKTFIELTLFEQPTKRNVAIKLFSQRVIAKEKMCAVIVIST